MDDVLKSSDADELFNPKDVTTVQENQTPAEVPNEPIIPKIEAEIMRGYREFDIKGVKGRICFPNMNDDEVISDEYSKEYTRLLSDKHILSESELTPLYERRGMWSKEKDKELEDLESDISNLREDMTTLKLTKEGNSVEAKTKLVEIHKKLKDAVLEYRILNLKKLELFSNSLENKAKAHAIKIKLIRCIKKEDDTCFWGSLEEMQMHPDKGFIHEVARRASLFWEGIPEDFLEGWQKVLFGKPE
jgi:hypothetical protein